MNKARTAMRPPYGRSRGSYHELVGNKPDPSISFYLKTLQQRRHRMNLETGAFTHDEIVHPRPTLGNLKEKVKGD